MTATGFQADGDVAVGYNIKLKHGGKIVGNSV
jgi:hypothetical protein